jgi:uncharacterized protein YeaO (DUF488 family)
MAISIVRLGSKRRKGEGLRLGTVRRPPRGVPKSDRQWLAFSKAYRREMSRPEASRQLELLAALSRTSALSVGCYCEDESRCHRSLLRALLDEHGARLR